MKNNHLHPADLAVCFSTDGLNLLAASFDRDGVIQTQWLPIEQSLYPVFRDWRTSLGHSTDLQTVFRFVPMFFNEQTHLAALPEEAVLLDDRELTVWLNNAAITDTSGKDGRPLFETPLEKSAYDFSRLPDGSVTLTEVPRERLREGLKQLLQAQPLDADNLNQLMRDATDETQPFLIHAVETRLRAVTRTLAAVHGDYFQNLKEDETIAVFAFTPEGCAFALWNKAHTFHTELGEWFNIHFDENEVPPGMDRAQYIAGLYMDSVFNFLNEQFHPRISPSDQSQPEINISRVYWTATDGLDAPLKTVLTDFSSQTGIDVQAAETMPMEELIVRGLLLGHDERFESLVPSINLANDITSQNNAIDAEEKNIKAVREQRQRQAVFACLLLPAIIALGAVAGLWLNNQRTAGNLNQRETTAKAEQSRLKPILQARADYEKTLNWYQDVLRQIIALRQKQTSSLSFAARLDPLYPSGSAFYVSDLKLAPGGLFELKGYTRDQIAVSQFVRSLEFAQDEQESRYFTGLTLDFRQGSRYGAAAAMMPAAGGGGISGNLPDGVSGFYIKGTFAPASVLKPQQAVAPPPPPVAAPAVPAVINNSSAPNSAAPVQPNINTGGNKQ